MTMPKKYHSGCIQWLLVVALVGMAVISQAAVPGKDPPLTVKIATLANFPPQYALDETGNPTGFAVEVMNRVADLANMVPEYVVFDHWLEAQQALRSGAVDIIPNMGITERRQVFADFTAPVETFPVSIFVRKAESRIKSAQGLAGHRVAVVEINVGYTLIKDRPDIELVVTHAASEAIMSLLAGQADALVYPQPVIDRLARQSGIEDRLKVVGKPLKEIVRGIAVRKGRADLRDRLDAAVRQFVTTDAYQRTYARWHGKPAAYWTRERVLSAAWLALAVFIVGMLVMRHISLLRFSKTLEKSVADRTAALAESEENFRLLFENASFGIAIHDLVFDERQTAVNYAFVNANPAFYKILGVNPGSAPGRLATELFGVADAPFLEQFSAVAMGKQPFDGEIDFSPMAKTFKVSAYSHRPNSFITVFEDITDRKQLEVAHRENTERLLAIFNTVPVGIFMVKDRIVLEANPRVSQLSGYELTEIVGKNTRQFYIDDTEWKRIGQVMQTGLAKRNLISVDAKMRHKDGRLRHVLMTCSRLSGETPPTILAALQDITERKEMEDVLKSSEQRFRALIDASAQIVWHCDPQGRVSEDSPSWRAYTGQTFEQWRGYGYVDAIHPDDRDAVMARWQEGLKKGVPVANEYRLIHHSGQWRWCQARAVPITDDSGQIVAWVGMNIDIHDRHETELALRESEKKFHQAMYHAPIGKAIVSTDGRWIDVNPALCRIVGYTREELLETDFQSISHPEDLDSDLDKIRQVLSGVRPTYQTEKRYIHKDGHFVWCQLNVALVRDDREVPQYFISQIQDITERKQNELQLAASQRRFEAIIDASPIPMALIDDAGNVLYLNPAFIDTIGYALEEIPTLTVWWPKAYPDAGYRETVKREWRQRVEHAEKDGSTFDPMEVRIHCKDGTIRTMVVTATLLSGFAETTRLVTLYDMTENKIIAERLKTLLATASDGIHVMDEKGNIVEFSDSFARMLGYTPEEVTNLNVADWEAQISEAELPSTIKGLLDASSTFETKHRRKDGSFFDAEINAKGIVLDGRLLLYASSRDISKRKNAERSLRYYETIASSIDTLLSMVDRNMVFLQVNDALAKFYNRKRDEIIGQSMYDIVGAENFSRIRPQIEKSFAGETAIQETWLELPDQERRFFKIIRHPMFDEDGCVYAFAGVGYDMTENYRAHEALSRVNEELHQANESLRAAKQAAESANLAKSVFLSNMTHELRTPLNAILGYAQILTVDKTLGEKQLGGIQTIHQAGEHLLMIINDVLDMSKIEAGKLELVSGRVQLQPFFQNIIDFFTYRAREKGLVVTFEGDASLPVAIVADELRLRQVIFNLLSNAIKFTAGGYCRLQADAVNIDAHRCRLNIRVEDSGVGIAHDEQEAVFEPFKQVGERLQQKEGSGLGLAISAQLIHRMGGKIVLTSPVNPTPTDGAGVGSRFSFSIDVDIAPSGSAVPARQRKQIVGYAHDHGGREPVKILVVDDKRSNREVLRDTLEPLGFAIEAAEDGRGVSAICLRTRPDLILMDLRMPNVDGFSAMQQLKHQDALKDIPVVAITASIAEADVLEKRCLEHGFQGFVLKPFLTEDLLETIASLLPIRLSYRQTQAHVTVPDDSSAITMPPVEVTARLADALAKGDIEGIIEHAAAIGLLEDGKYRDYSRRIRALANDFNFAELEKLVLSER